MPRFRITTSIPRFASGVRIIEPGMSVEVVTSSAANPIVDNGGQAVEDAFQRIYGVSLKKANALCVKP